MSSSDMALSFPRRHELGPAGSHKLIAAPFVTGATLAGLVIALRSRRPAIPDFLDRGPPDHPPGIAGTATARCSAGAVALQRATCWIKERHAVRETVRWS